eukprot:47075_1
MRQRRCTWQASLSSLRQIFSTLPGEMLVRPQPRESKPCRCSAQGVIGGSRPVSPSHLAEAFRKLHLDSAGASSTCPRPELRVMPQCVRRRPETHRVTPPKPMADVSPKAPSSKAQHASICRFRHPPSPTQSKSNSPCGIPNPQVHLPNCTSSVSLGDVYAIPYDSNLRSETYRVTFLDDLPLIVNDVNTDSFVIFLNVSQCTPFNGAPEVEFAFDWLD